MHAGVPSCTLRTPVMEVARRMQDEGLSAIVVASAGSDLIAGTISELDLLRAVREGQTEGMASDIMSTETVPTVPATANLAATVRQMSEEGIPLLVVVDGEPEHPVGALTAADIAGLLARA